MAQVDIKCFHCGRVFQAEDSLAQAFCVYCGARNARLGSSPVSGTEPGSQPAPAAAGPTSTSWPGPTEETSENQPAQVDPTLAAAFERARYKIINRKTGQRADLFVGLWSALLFHSQNSRTRWGMKSAQKEVEQFFKRSELLEAIALAGESGLGLLRDQLLDSAVLFLQTCRDDRRYGALMMDMIRMKPEDVARKAAADVCNSFLSLLLHLGRPAHSDLLIYAAVLAYPQSFTNYRDMLGQEMEKLPISDRQLIMTIVRDVSGL